MTIEEAIETIQEMCKRYIFLLDEDEAIDMAIESLHREEAEEKGYCNRIKPKDVEVVVRCKDCRFAEKGTALSVEETDEGTPRHYIDWVKCHNYDIHKGFARYVGEDDYCSWGERKGGNDK